MSFIIPKKTRQHGVSTKKTERRAPAPDFVAPFHRNRKTNERMPAKGQPGPFEAAADAELREEVAKLKKANKALEKKVKAKDKKLADACKLLEEAKDGLEKSDAALAKAQADLEAVSGGNLPPSVVELVAQVGEYVQGRKKDNGSVPGVSKEFVAAVDALVAAVQ